MDLLPVLARLLFLERFMFDVRALPAAIMLSVGLQHKTIDEVSAELALPVNQVLSMFMKVCAGVCVCVRVCVNVCVCVACVEHCALVFHAHSLFTTQSVVKATNELDDILKEAVAATLPAAAAPETMKPLAQSLSADLAEAGEEVDEGVTARRARRASEERTKDALSMC
jgi:hypothetical protein